MEKQNHLFSTEDATATIMPDFATEFPNCYFNPNWDHPSDPSDPFESALSSMVSSPVAAAGGGDGVVLRELIGRLGSICSSGDIDRSPHHSYNTSCYNTPLSSPPKLSLMEQARVRGGFAAPSDPTFAALSANAEFADRAARLSCLGGSGQQSQSQPDRKLSRCSSPDNGFEGSSVSEQIPSESAKKRKPVSRGKGKETTLPSPAKTDPKSDESNAKKRKQNEESGGNETENKSGPKAEPPKDYIHVRARRGQATDSHSLAERVRREKIGERMKFLQDLVPGCNKVIGKAVMLDEIINYVQSLQRQVEFLSMKLSTVNPRMEFNTEALLSKDNFQSRGSIPQNIYPLDPTFSYGYQSTPAPFSMPPLNSAFLRNTNMQFPSVDGFSDVASQTSAFWEGELHSVVQMGSAQNQLPNFHNGIGHMKVEL